MEPLDSYTAIVAIDFGTTRSGYYFAFTARPDKIHSNIKWLGAPPEAKTLTEVLLRKDFSLVAFGYEARNKFASIKDKSEYLYFSNFKMVLHNKEGIVRSVIKATNCETCIPTETLVSICLRVIKDKAIAQLNTSKTVSIELARIRWVITVPAIWDFPARQVMYNAAEKAGIKQKNVLIALEPEAAVLTCLDNERIADVPVVDSDFMVVDAGGGTVDITVHRNRSEGGLVELHSPSGGAWGSFYINKEFEKLLEDLLGNTSEMRNTTAWYQIMDMFEIAKVNFNPEDPVGSVCLSPINLKEVTNDLLENAISNYNTCNGTDLQLGRSQMLDFTSFLSKQFTQLISNITAHISKLLAKATLQHVKYLFLVGGFAESLQLTASIKKEFEPRVKVIVAPSPGVSVMNGAVRYGFDPSIIKERIATLSIGIQHAAPWDDAKHSGKSQTLGDNRQRYCTELVHCFVHAKDKIPVGYQVTQRCTPSTARQSSLRVSLFGSSNPSITYVSDKGTRLLGFLELELPDQGVYSREVDVTLLFGGTTIDVSAIYKKTGESVKARIELSLDDTPVLLETLKL